VVETRAKLKLAGSITCGHKTIPRKSFTNDEIGRREEALSAYVQVLSKTADMYRRRITTLVSFVLYRFPITLTLHIGPCRTVRFLNSPTSESGWAGRLSWDNEDMPALATCLADCVHSTTRPCEQCSLTTSCIRIWATKLLLRTVSTVPRNRGPKAPECPTLISVIRWVDQTRDKNDTYNEH
jgi:hypothetical protein